MQNKFDVVIFNPILHPDVIMYPQPGEKMNYARLLPTYSREIRIGAGGYTGMALSKLGFKCCFLDAIGNDMFGQFTIDEINRSGFDTSFLSRFDGDHMFCMILVQDGEGGTMVCNYPEKFKATTFDDYMKMIVSSPETDAFYIYSWFWSFVKPNLASQPTSELVKEISKKGIPVFLDINFKTFEAPPEFELNELKKALPYVDYLLPNCYDAEILIGKHDVETTMKNLVDLGANNILLKSGEEGSFLWDGNVIAHLPGYNVDVLDTTGAGDMFGSGLVYGLHSEHTLYESAELANALAAYGISHIKKNKYPDRNQLRNFINETKIR